MARMLGVLRLSHFTDESTSIERQREAVQRLADQDGHVIVGWAVDADVSGSIAPWLRPELGQWLPSTIGQTVSPETERWSYDQSRAAEWDLIGAAKMDRISRRLIHQAQLIQWVIDNGRNIKTPEGLDIQDPKQRAFVAFLGALAEGELEEIRDRCKRSATKLMQSGRHRGGSTPYGYRPVKKDGKEGWYVEPCPDTSPVVVSMVQRVINGQSVNSVTTWLNESGIATPKNATLMRAGKPTEDDKQWTHSTVTKILRGRALLGQIEVTDRIVTNGKTKRVTKLLRDEDGSPVQRSEPLVSQDEFDTLQETLGKASQGKAPYRPFGASLLLHIAHCTECQSPMYVCSSGDRRYYRCAKYLQCGNRRVRLDVLDEYLSSVFLTMAGELSVMRKVFVPGSDHLEQLETAKRAMDELIEEKRDGLYSSEHGKKNFRQMYSQLEQTVSELESLPVVEGRWEDQDTGETYTDMWGRFDTAERNQLLRDAGIRVTVATDNVPSPEPEDNTSTERGMRIGTGRVVVFVPPDLKDRVNSRSPGAWDRVSSISLDAQINQDRNGEESK